MEMLLYKWLGCYTVYVFAIGRVKMERGISKASENEYIISQARSQVENEFQPSPDSPDSTPSVFHSGITACGFIDTPVYTFILPDLTIYPGKASLKPITIPFEFIIMIELSTDRGLSWIPGKRLNRTVVLDFLGAKWTLELVGRNRDLSEALALGHNR